MKMCFFLGYKNSRKDLKKANRNERVHCIQTAVETQNNLS